MHRCLASAGNVKFLYILYTFHAVIDNFFLNCLCFSVLVKQVANLNPKDNTYSLKDFIYRDVQRDWPGYSEDEKSQVDRILARYWNGLLAFLMTLYILT